MLSVDTWGEGEGGGGGWGGGVGGEEGGEGRGYFSGCYNSPFVYFLTNSGWIKPQDLGQGPGNFLLYVPIFYFPQNFQ